MHMTVQQRLRQICHRRPCDRHILGDDVLVCRLEWPENAARWCERCVMMEAAKQIDRLRLNFDIHG